MLDKNGFIRTLEALIAIFLLLGLILYIFSTVPKKAQGIPDIIEKNNNFIINEFLNNITLRSCITQTDNDGSCNRSLENLKTTQENKDCKDVFSDFILKSIPIGYSFSCEICKTSKSCSNIGAAIDKAVYPKSGFVYSDLKKEGRLVRIYLYQK